MKLLPKSTLSRLLWLAVIIGLLALAGPSLIHLVYSVATPQEVRQARTERYHELANAEAFDPSLSDAQRMKMQQERIALFYWFHARGWNIDEGDDESSWLTPWEELMRHWRGPREANHVPAPGPATGPALSHPPAVDRLPRRSNGLAGRVSEL